MSSNVLDQVIVPENAVRDYLNSPGVLNANYSFDIQNQGQALGLDVFIRNRGAAAITIALNGTGAITVDPGDVYRVNNFKFWLVEVVAAVNYDLQIFGIRTTTLKRMGVLPDTF